MRDPLSGSDTGDPPGVGAAGSRPPEVEAAGAGPPARIARTNAPSPPRNRPDRWRRRRGRPASPARTPGPAPDPLADAPGRRASPGARRHRPPARGRGGGRPPPRAPRRRSASDASRGTGRASSAARSRVASARASPPRGRLPDTPRRGPRSPCRRNPAPPCCRRGGRRRPAPPPAGAGRPSRPRRRRVDRAYGGKRARGVREDRMAPGAARRHGRLRTPLSDGVAPDGGSRPASRCARSSPRPSGSRRRHPAAATRGGGSVLPRRSPRM